MEAEEKVEAVAVDDAFIIDIDDVGKTIVVVCLFNGSTASSVCAAARARRRRMHRGGRGE
jgi:hypothetical protein